MLQVGNCVVRRSANGHLGSLVKALYLGHLELIEQVYRPSVRNHLATLVQTLHEGRSWEEIVQSAGNDLGEVEVIFSTWGMPKMDEEFLRRLPGLRAVFYAAGSVKGFATEEAYARGIRISSAWGANAIPVAEFTVAAITLSLKQFWACASATRRAKNYARPLAIPGTFRSTVGLVSLGMIGKLVVQRLRSLDLHVLAYDPFISAQEAKTLGVELVSLPVLFERSDVVSVHTPWLKETEKLITGELLQSLRPGATFINTSRGAVVDEPAMVEVARERPDVSFVLDVTYPEPPPPESALYELPNVVLTPHIAGSAGGEVARMGEWMAEEFDRFRLGQPLAHEVTKEMLARMA